jgi:prepilin-type N-terminal cleavage/methylation domain-containing protein
MLMRQRSTAFGRRGLRARPGFSMTELTVVIVLLGIVMGTLLSMVTRQQRFYRGARETIETRSQVRQGIDLLRTDLRGVSSVGGDIYPNQMAETSIEFRATTGTSIACAIPVPGGTTLIVPPPGTLASGTILSKWRQDPAVGDSVWIYDLGANAAASADDAWVVAQVTGVAPLIGACGGTPFVTVADAGRTGHRLTLSAALPLTTPAGTPLRLYRRVRYELMQASDRRWYLGYSECHPGAAPTCSPLEPASGPYLPQSAEVGKSGIGFYYFDVNGNPTIVPAQVARIDVVVRGETEQPVAVTGSGAQPTFRDTSRVAVGLRNRT